MVKRANTSIFWAKIHALRESTYFNPPSRFSWFLPKFWSILDLKEGEVKEGVTLPLVDGSGIRLDMIRPKGQPVILIKRLYKQHEEHQNSDYWFLKIEHCIGK